MTNGLTQGKPTASLPTFSGIQSSSMVEHAAVNRGVVGSSPTSGAKFPKENCQSGFSAQILHTKTPDSRADDRPMMFPLTIKHRGLEAKVYPARKP